MKTPVSEDFLNKVAGLRLVQLFLSIPKRNASFLKLNKYPNNNDNNNINNEYIKIISCVKEKSK